MVVILSVSTYNIIQQIYIKSNNWFVLDFIILHAIYEFCICKFIIHYIYFFLDDITYNNNLKYIAIIYIINILQYKLITYVS